MIEKTNGVLPGRHQQDITSNRSKVKKSLAPASPLTEEIISDVTITEQSLVQKGRVDINNISIAELREKFLVDLSLPLSNQPVCLEIKGKHSTESIGNYGGITLFTAKAKAGKTAAVSLLVSALIMQSELNKKIVAHLLEGKRIVQVFDTEQSAYHVQKVGKRILHVAGNPEHHNLQVYKLRTEPNDLKKKIIEKIIYNTSGLGAIVIDGARDLLFDFNSPEESTVTAADLLRWAEELSILIIVVLHQNKNDNNARGHYGAELKNKAEIIANVSKDKSDGIFTVEPEDCRDKDFEPFAFTFDKDGLPFIVDEWGPDRKDTAEKKSVIPNKIPDEFHQERLREVFAAIKKPGYADLYKQIKAAFLPVYNTFGDNKAKDCISYYLAKGWLSKDESGRYPKYELNQFS